MRLIILVLALGACGRIGFDDAARDVPVDALLSVDADPQLDAAPLDAAPLDAGPGICQVPGEEQLAIGYQHACALRGGRMWCWGDNEFGQLGTGDANLGDDRDQPTRVDGREEWVKAAAGLRHTCALDCWGAIWCWGGNDRGQLGADDGIPGADSSVPQQIADARPWIDLFAGRDHTCAIAADETLWCWGGNGAAQLGIGTQGGAADTGRPTQVVMEPPDPAEDFGWRQVGAGDDHTCAVKHDETLWCWGANGNGQLGQGGGDLDRTRPNRVAAGQRWSLVSSGLDASCALDDGQELYCWGRNEEGQLGLGGTGDRDFPEAVMPATRWSELSFGYEHACGVQSDGTLWCWGANRAGELGIGAGSVGSNMQAPAQVGAATGWRDLGAGQEYTCAIRDGLRCWGEGSQGRLGNGGSTDLADPSPVIALP